MGAAVQQDGMALQGVSGEMKGGRDVVRAAIGKNGRALKCASEEIKGDRDVVKAAVHKDGMALKWASKVGQIPPGRQTVDFTVGSLKVYILADSPWDLIGSSSLSVTYSYHKKNQKW